MVYRNENVNKLRLKLEEIERSYDEFKAKPETGADEISEYCSRLRNQVHLQTDILIEHVHQFNEDMLAQIDEYEKQCMNSFEENSVLYDNKKRTFMNEKKSGKTPFSLNKFDQIYFNSEKLTNQGELVFRLGRLIIR